MFNFFRYYTVTLSNSTICRIYATYRSLYLVLPAWARTLATVLSYPYGIIKVPRHAPSKIFWIYHRGWIYPRVMVHPNHPILH